MLLAHKVALDPNMAQRVYFARAAGTARFAWNWALGAGRVEEPIQGRWQADRGVAAEAVERAQARELSLDV